MSLSDWNHTPAGRRYTERFLPTMTAYVVLLLGSIWIEQKYHVTGALLTVLALLPALALVASIAVIGLYLVEETDEYLRNRLATASLIGTGLALAVMTVWGFLEEAGQVPHLPAYSAYILWCVGMGLGQCAMSIRDWMAGGGA